MDLAGAPRRPEDQAPDAILIKADIDMLALNKAARAAQFGALSTATFAARTNRVLPSVTIAEISPDSSKSNRADQDGCLPSPGVQSKVS